MKKALGTFKQPNNAPDDKGQTEETRQKYLAKKECEKIANAHCLAARPHEAPCVIHSTNDNGEGTNKFENIVIATLAPVIDAVGVATHLGFLRFNVGADRRAIDRQSLPRERPSRSTC